MKKNFFKTSILVLSILSSANISAQCTDCGNVNGDFETITAPHYPDNTWFNDHITNWKVSHGTPTFNTMFTNNVWMWCAEFGTSGIAKGEGIYTDYNFIDGETYTLCYDLWRDPGSNTASTFRAELSNSLTPVYISPTPGGFIPSTTGNQALATQPWTATGSWVTITETFTASDDFSQLWFFPYLTSSSDTDQAACRIDNVCVTWEADPCNFEPEFILSGALDGCTTIFEDISTISVHPSIQVLKTEWTFGDGHSGTGSSTTHLYTEPGTYEVCMTVWITNGSECCKKEVCETITIDEVCSPCNYMMDHPGFEISIESSEEDPLTASFTLDGMGDGMMEVYGYYWDFGDGTTGIGQSVTHVYEEGVFGTFPVWGTIFYYNPFTGECCSRTTYGDYVIGGGMAPLDDQGEITEGKEKLKSNLTTTTSILKISPNPSHGEFLVELDKGEVIKNIRVYDRKGTLITEINPNGVTNQYQLDLSTLEKGMYIIVINEFNNNVRRYGKVVIN